MIDSLFKAIAALGSAGIQHILGSAGESAIKKYHDSNAWKNLLVGTGEFFTEFEKIDNSFFADLERVLSRDNLSRLAKDIQTDDGYDLKNKLYKSIMQLMDQYEIPLEIAESYTIRIIYAVLEQLRTIDPDKYEHYFLQEMRDEQKKTIADLQNRIEKIHREMQIYQREKIAIKSSGQMDIELRRSTQNPSIGIDFFTIDDDRFQEEFEDKRYDEILYIKGRNREETIYCVLNELLKLNDMRPVYVVENPESWDKLRSLNNTGNIYIPWFYADGIVAIENNYNYFIINDNTPVFESNILELRLRTRSTLSICLQNAGMDYREVTELLADSHGLYPQIKKRLFRGLYLKQPSWISGISEKAKKTCLLIGSWEEIDGDKLIIESLYGDSYDKFIEEVLPYIKGEDPLLYMINRNGSVYYYLASTDNIWSYINVLTNEPIWETFINAVLCVIDESEDLFTYDYREALIARFKGEKLFWSETLRKGMLRTLLIKGIYHKDEDTQYALNELVKRILDGVKIEKQWIYISRFWNELCEISPSVILNRLENEFIEDTGLFSLFQNQSSEILRERNAYVDILWGLEQYLVQKDMFWSAFRWLLMLDDQGYEYKSNSVKDIFEKVFCIWANFSSLQTSEDKITAANVAMDISGRNAWDYLFSAIDHNGKSIVGELSYPKYREHDRMRTTTREEMQKAFTGYFYILMKHMDHSADRWIRMIDLSVFLEDDLRRYVIDQCISEISQMADIDVMRVKNGVRHLLYRHRYFASSDWAAPEDRLAEYEVLLKEIKLETPEYEYSYLFDHINIYPLLHPVPYKQGGEREQNEAAKQQLIKEQLTEFQNRGYDLAVLARACAQESYSYLGRYLAKYWNNGEWDYTAFKRLLSVVEDDTTALDYLDYYGKGRSVPYSIIIEDLSKEGFSPRILARIYRAEAAGTKDVPLVTHASEEIKTEFWKYPVIFDECNDTWAITESRQYASLDVYLDQIYSIHYERPMSAERIYECLVGIEDLPHPYASQMMSYHVKELITVIQDAFIEDTEKCAQIARHELFFMNLLEWGDMRCFRRMVKQQPDLYAQIIAGICDKDHGVPEEHPFDEKRFHYMYTIYEKAQFCPAENNGVVDEELLEQWMDLYRKQLIKNDQESHFTSTLGRLFSFSPPGKDGHEPCEPIRKMIEKYGDDRMIGSYRTAVFNRRGIFSPSAGRDELRLAEEFKANARYLEPVYPLTAKIFYGLHETYKSESERERTDAENGW